MKTIPLGARVLVKPATPEVKINGIVLPDISKKRSDRGKVVSVGPGRTLENGTVVPMNIKKGDTVLFNEYVGEEVEVDGKKLKILRDTEILAKLTEGD